MRFVVSIPDAYKFSLDFFQLLRDMMNRLFVFMDSICVRRKIQHKLMLKPLAIVILKTDRAFIHLDGIRIFNVPKRSYVGFKMG